MKTLSKKFKSICLLTLSVLLCVSVALVALISNNNKSSYASSANEGFNVKGAYLQIEEGTANDSKITISFTSEIDQNYFNAVTKGNSEEVKIGLLVGPSSKLAQITNYQTAIAQGYTAFGVGSKNSGAQEIAFRNGMATFECGVNYNEATLSATLGAGKTLIDATSVELSAIPYVIELNNVENSADDVATCYLNKAITRSPRAMLNELYVRGANFDYENNSDVANVPVKISKSIMEKFVANVDDSAAYSDNTNNLEYFISKEAGKLYSSSQDSNVLTAKNIFTPAAGYTTGDKVYIAGLEVTPSNSSEQNSLDAYAIPEGEEYSYSIAFFKANGSIVNYTVKVATRVITVYNSGDSGSKDGLVDKIYLEDLDKTYAYTSIFANRLISAKDKSLTETYDGYYVLGNNLQINHVNGIGNGVITDTSQGFAAIDGSPNQIKNDGTKGFTGTFDGRGFSIYDGPRGGSLGYAHTRGYQVFSSGAGIFTWICGGTVKNFGIINTTADSAPRYTTFLAHAITGNSLIENVYIRALPTSLSVHHGENSISRERGSIVAGYSQNSTFKNVIIESDFLSAKDGTAGYIDGKNHLSAFAGANDKGNTFENVFVLGDTPMSHLVDKDKKLTTFYVGELPKISETEYAVSGEAYALKDYPVLKAAYGEQAKFMLNAARRGMLRQNPDNPSTFVADIESADEVTMVFILQYQGAKQFAGYRELAEYINNSQNVAVKNAFANSVMFNVASNGFVSLNNVPATKIAANNSYNFVGVVDDVMFVSLGYWANNSSPINSIANCPAAMIMADENGKFYADLTMWKDFVTGTQRVVVFNPSNPSATGETTIVDASTIATATRVEIPANVVLQRR